MLLQTHEKDFADSSATQKKSQAEGVDIFHFEGDKIKEAWTITDLSDLIQWLFFEVAKAPICIGIPILESTHIIDLVLLYYIYYYCQCINNYLSNYSGLFIHVDNGGAQALQTHTPEPAVVFER